MNELESLGNMESGTLWTRVAATRRLGSRPFEDDGSTSTKAMTRTHCIDPGMLLKSYGVRMEAIHAWDSSRQCHPWRPSRR